MSLSTILWIGVWALGWFAGGLAIGFMWGKSR